MGRARVRTPRRRSRGLESGMSCLGGAKDKKASERWVGSRDRIHHSAVMTKDIDAAVSWYTAQFNCGVCYQDDIRAMLDFANVKMALVKAEQHPHRTAILRAWWQGVQEGT